MALISLLILMTLMPYQGKSDHVNDGVVNGTEAKPHSRPYMVSVQVKEKHRCGGFLVSDQFVMTAGHCWLYGDNLTVVIGAHDLQSKHDHHIRMPVKFYHIYPAYYMVNNDIMLLQLESKVQNNSKINYIEIMKTNKNVNANSLCSTAGWGRTTTSGNVSERLMEVDVIVQSQHVCAQLWGRKFSHSKMMCAGGHGGFCKGDSGGPLVCNKTAVGIVSFMEENNCDKPHRPNVYTKISNYLQWINNIIHSI